MSVHVTVSKTNRGWQVNADGRYAHVHGGTCQTRAAAFADALELLRELRDEIERERDAPSETA